MAAAAYAQSTASARIVSAIDRVRLVASVSGRRNACLSRCAGRDETTVLVDGCALDDQDDDRADSRDQDRRSQDERLDIRLIVAASTLVAIVVMIVHPFSPCVEAIASIRAAVAIEMVERDQCAGADRC